MLTRRQLLQRALYGANALHLRALVTGIPAAILAAPSARHARAAAGGIGVGGQYVLFSSSASGDPLNANVPGCYDDPNINHSTDPSMAATKLSLAGKTVTAARVWSTLPASMLDTACFFHHATFTAGHPDEGKVLRLQGAVTKGEMLPSLIAASLAARHGTVREQAISFGLDGVFHKGLLQPRLSPSALANALNAPGDGLGDQNLLALRDDTVDKISAWAKAQGKDYQRDLVDRFATSRQEVRTMQGQLLTALQAIRGNDPTSQFQAAMVLFKMNVCPSVVTSLSFGGDNHDDQNFGGEVNAHRNSIALLAKLPEMAAAAGLTDKVTFAATNVFGRNLAVQNTQRGRDHNANHAVSLIIGSGVRGGVVGGPGLSERGTEYSAQPIDAATGAVNPRGDVPYEDLFASYGRTLCAAVGLPAADIDDRIRTGRTIAAVLRG